MAVIADSASTRIVAVLMQLILHMRSSARCYDKSEAKKFPSIPAI